jgi:hypothetical protein
MKKEERLKGTKYIKGTNRMKKNSAGGVDVSLLAVLCCQVEISVGLVTRPEESYQGRCA